MSELKICRTTARSASIRSRSASWVRAPTSLADGTAFASSAPAMLANVANGPVRSPMPNAPPAPGHAPPGKLVDGVPGADSVAVPPPYAEDQPPPHPEALCGADGHPATPNADQAPEPPFTDHPPGAPQPGETGRGAKATEPPPYGEGAAAAPTNSARLC
jgi:hypothetical protein